LPECDGIEVILELARRRIRTPLVLVTGAVPAVVQSAEILARVHGLNVLNLLIKPVHFRQLSATLDAALAA
jgi:response regulator of citrate/malate metabolism